MRRLAGLCLLLAAMGGCSVQFAYNNVDRLARWSVDDYLDMDDAQRAYFDAAFERLWTWHRYDHLPRYAEFLEALVVILDDGTTDAEMQQLVDVVVGWAGEIEERALPVAVEMLASLSDAQVARLRRTMEERNVEIAEPELGVSLDRAQQGWVNEFSERFTQFSGRLNGAQRRYLEAQSIRYLPERVLWADYRRRWQRDLLALLEGREDVAAFDRGLRDLAANREGYYGAELAGVFDSNERLVKDASVWMLNHLTPRQQSRLFERLADLAEDLRSLAERDGKTALAAQAPLPCLLDC